MPLPKTPLASIYTYPWDLADEIPDHALGVIKATAGQTVVSLATSYHVSTYFLPHNPKRQLYYGEDGMILFTPSRRRYAGTKIDCRVSEVVDGPDYYRHLVDSIRKHDLGYVPWMVYCYNHHLARTYPDCARQDALGNRYEAQVCVANPDVRAYFRELTADVLKQFAPDAMHFESLSYLRWDYGFRNPKVFVEITERDKFLMGLCFCPHCRRAAPDGDAIREAVAEQLRKSLPLNPTDANRQPVSQEWLASAFDGRLATYLQARTETATSLYVELADLCHAEGCEVQSNPSTAGAVAYTGLDPGRVNAVTDLFTVSANPDLKSLRQSLGEGKRLLPSYQPDDMDERLPERALAARKAGADGFTFYNYGLVRLEHLAWIGRSRAAWSV